MRIADLLTIRPISISAPGFIAIYVGAIGISEIVAATVSPFFGIFSHAIIIMLLVFHAALSQDVVSRRAFQALILIPLMRLLSVTLPIQELNPLYWNFIIGLPFLIAIGFMVRLLNLSARDVGLRPIRWKFDALVAASGFILSPIAYYLSPPTYLPNSLMGYEIVLFTLIVFIFAGFTEELVFRGILQRTMQNVSRQNGIALVSILYAMTYVGSFSLSYILFIGVVGQFFATCRQRGSLWGVILAHSIMILGILVQHYYI